MPQTRILVFSQPFVVNDAVKQMEIPPPSGHSDAVTYTRAVGLRMAPSAVRAALALTVFSRGIVSCGEPLLEQRTEALTIARPAAPAVRQRPTNVVERVDNPPSPSGLGSPPPSSGELGPGCTPILSLVDSMREIVATRWLIVEGTVASTPTSIFREREDGGRWGLGQRYRWMSFEFDVQRTSDAAASRTARIMVSHIEQTDSKTSGGAYESLRGDPLDARPRRATVSAGQRRLLILARDSFVSTHWQLIAIIPTDGARLREDIAGRRSNDTLDSVFEDYRIEARGSEAAR